ncbi:homoserine dehydrogenase [Jidongwangia harbinensis]|uniref:homoserine dehydrogenase n=1 Tax=Jidongwangia harbinensis TaxID=2878561 RepID=UPI001CD9E92F|nr:homoserine dehydrogenase [Jidongwangia harbinensis]MCA2218367.1 homoserine dehydrogenase [Jidongwangia harbinensis]
MSAPVSLALAGLGNVGAAVLDLLDACDSVLDGTTAVRLTGVADLSGSVVDPAGINVGALRKLLADGAPVAAAHPAGRTGAPPAGMVHASRPDVLLEATPVDLRDGGPGLRTVRTALRRGTHAVLANKGPVALAYRELAALSDLSGPGKPSLRFSACAAGALPVINLGRRDLAGSPISRMEAVFNGTTHSILRAMEQGRSYADALADAQRRGIAEADPGLDVSGLDAAAKLVITANAVLGQPTELADVPVTGITGLTAAEVAGAPARGERVVLLCLAERDSEKEPYRLSVRPAALPLDHPLARLHPDEMGVVFQARAVDRLSAASLEPGPEPAAAAMIRDVIDILRSRPCP